MNKRGILSLGIVSLLCCAWPSHAKDFSKTVTAPWKTNKVILIPNAKADLIRISHVNQRTKIHSVAINKEKPIYTFESDTSLIDDRGQIKSEGAPLNVRLHRRIHVASIEIVAEGWNRPEDGNRFLVELIRLRRSEGLDIAFDARWTGHSVELEKFNETRVSAVEVTASDRTKVHELELLLKNGESYDLMKEEPLASNQFIDESVVINFTESLRAIGIKTELESYSSQSGGSTKVNFFLKGKSRKPDSITCKDEEGRTYKEGDTWDQIVELKERPAKCSFGGSKVDVFRVVQPKICLGGSSENNGQIRENYLESRGKCSERPREATCNAGGRVYRLGQTWEEILGTTDRKATCAHGGSKVNVHDVIQPKICRRQGARNNGSSFERFKESNGNCFCRTARGLTRRHNETWTNSPPNQRIEKAGGCPHGGNLVNVFQKLIDRTCRDGKIRKLREYTGQIVETRGSCNPAPKASCGDTPHRGTVWKRVRGETISVPGTCRFGGTKNTIYAKRQRHRCRNGKLRPMKGPENIKRGRQIRVEDNCVKGGQSCGNRAHNSTWTIPTGKTEKSARACGRGNRGTQEVVFDILQGKICKNGKVKNNGRTRKEKRAGRCIMPKVQCPAIKITPAGRIERNNFCDRESFNCRSIPKSNAGKSFSGTCRRGRDEDPGNYTVTCQANGRWSATGSCQPRRGGGDR